MKGKFLLLLREVQAHVCVAVSGAVVVAFVVVPILLKQGESRNQVESACVGHSLTCTHM